MEYLGQQVDVRKALRLCGLYESFDDAIDPSIRQAIHNQMDSGDWHFKARI
jgi:hypothetical protein